MVVGRWVQADSAPVAGRAVVFTPQRGGVWHGRVINRAPVRVTTDAGGWFRLALAPSAVVGSYEVAMDNVKLSVDVPDAATAELAKIVTR